MVDFFSGILAMEVHQSGFLSSRHTRPSRERTSWPSLRTFLLSANRHYTPPTMLLLINTLFHTGTRNTTSFANNLVQRVSLSSSIFEIYRYHLYIYIYIELLSHTTFTARAILKEEDFPSIFFFCPENNARQFFLKTNTFCANAFSNTVVESSGRDVHPSR